MILREVSVTMRSLQCFLRFHGWLYGSVQAEHILERDPGSGCQAHKLGGRHFEAIPVRLCRRCLILEGYDLPEGSTFGWDDWGRCIVRNQDLLGRFRGGSWIYPRREEVVNAIRTMLIWDEFDKLHPKKWAEEQVGLNKQRERRQNG